MAGVYFAFSGFHLRSLATMPDSESIAAMLSINRVIPRSLLLRSSSPRLWSVWG